MYKNRQHPTEVECRLFCCPILLGRCRFCSFLKLLSYRHTAEAVLLLSKKWPNATSSSFFGFCLSHTLPGGKTRKVRKPSVFIRFDAHVVKAGIKIRGCGPLSTPNIYAKRKIYRFPLDFSAISIFFYCFPLGFSFLFASLLFSFLLKRKEKEEVNKITVTSPRRTWRISCPPRLRPRSFRLSHPGR